MKPFFLTALKSAGNCNIVIVNEIFSGSKEEREGAREEFFEQLALHFTLCVLRFNDIVSEINNGDT